MIGLSAYVCASAPPGGLDRGAHGGVQLHHGLHDDAGNASVGPVPFR